MGGGGCLWCVCVSVVCVSVCVEEGVMMSSGADPGGFFGFGRTPLITNCTKK